MSMSMSGVTAVSEPSIPPSSSAAPMSAPASGKPRLPRAHRPLRAAKEEHRLLADGSAPPLSPRRREALGIVLLAIGLFVGLSAISFVFVRSGGELMGPVGRFVASGLYQGVGVSVLVVAAGMVYAAVRYLRAQPLRPRPVPALGAIGLFFSTAVLLHLLSGLGLRVHGMPLGGALGEYGAELGLALLGTLGTLLVTLCLLLLSLLATTAFTLTHITDFATRVGKWVAARGLELWQHARSSLASAPKSEAQQPAPEAAAATPAVQSVKPAPAAPPPRTSRRDGVPAPVKDYGDDRDQRASGRPSVLPPIIVERKPAERATAPAAPSEPASVPIETPSEATIETSAETTRTSAAVPSEAPESLTECAADTVATPIVVMPEHESPSLEALAAAEPPVRAGAVSGRPARKPHANYHPVHAGPYQPPPLVVFDYEEPAQRDLDRRAMLDLAQRLEGTLGDYQVKGRVTAIHPGPVVTMYEFVPAPGIKLSKITALSSDLAMALEALRVRIVAPIPGKAAVGIEVPNRARETVYLKEILSDVGFTQARSKLTMALGKDISGAPVCVDLAKMPHLLVAGTTGSGKSVSVNGMVCSLLCNASPDDVKMIMIDPKMLELSIYEGIPHLLLPVVTDPKKANLALKWAVDEMERRYELISKAGLRDIGGYNKKVEKQLADIESQQQELFGEEEYDIADRPTKLPYIVVLIDEFADLMMVASKEVETSVARIAQKARAAGIHLILATQRPSVDVITGLIKANFPSRIAFQVASRVDSRTILDQQGAENLLGMGDMLFTDRGQALRRVHGALITDAEVHRVVEHLKQQGQPIYDMDILKPRCDDEAEEFEEDMSDELYDQAVRLVAETRQASISMVQRRLRIGYNRAARMIERMEREGIVSAADGPKGREVLISSL